MKNFFARVFRYPAIQLLTLKPSKSAVFNLIRNWYVKGISHSLGSICNGATLLRQYFEECPNELILNRESIGMPTILHNQEQKTNNHNLSRSLIYWNRYIKIADLLQYTTLKLHFNDFATKLFLETKAIETKKYQNRSFILQQKP